MGIPLVVDVGHDESDATLDEPPRQQALTTVFVGVFLAEPIEFLGCPAFPGQVERLGSTGLHPEGEFVGRQPGVETAVVLPSSTIHRGQATDRRQAGGLDLPRHRHRQVLDRLLDVRNRRPLEGGRQEGRPVDHLPGQVALAADRDKPGQAVVLAAQPVQSPGPDAGTRQDSVTGGHLADRPAVLDLVTVHRADDAQVIGMSRQVGHQLAEPSPRFAVLLEAEGRRPAVGRRIPGDSRQLDRDLLVVGQFRLRVEQVDLGRPTAHKQEYHAFRPGSVMRLPGGQGVAARRCRPSLLGQQSVKRQQREPGRRATQQPAPADPELGHALSTIVSQHR